MIDCDIFETVYLQKTKDTRKICNKDHGFEPKGDSICVFNQKMEYSIELITIISVWHFLQYV